VVPGLDEGISGSLFLRCYESPAVAPCCSGGSPAFAGGVSLFYNTSLCAGKNTSRLSTLQNIPLKGDRIGPRLERSVEDCKKQSGIMLCWLLGTSV